MVFRDFSSNSLPPRPAFASAQARARMVGVAGAIERSKGVEAEGWLIPTDLQILPGNARCLTALAVDPLRILSKRSSNPTCSTWQSNAEMRLWITRGT